MTTRNLRPSSLATPLSVAVATVLLVQSSLILPAHADSMACTVRAALSSDGAISRPLRRALQEARSEVLAALYGFNNPLLARELIDLAGKGVRVRVKIDAGKTTGRKTAGLIDLLRRSGVSVQAVAADGRNHNKFVVIDGKQVITGSYNWTTRADENWENLLFLDCGELARRYEAEWRKID